ncbi:MAG: peroxiredoxin [Sphaerochaetaceae bacterium]|jgi:peroxiredoxin Q/BCP
MTIGAKLPPLTLLDDQGNSVSMDQFAGSYVVLYTYPKDNTPGCTSEACSFRDNSSAITDQKAIIVGVSADSVASHAKFKAQHNLPFTLLSDPDRLLLQALGAWGEKVRFGKKTMGILRMTFLFDPQGRLVHIWPKVSVQTHGEEIAAFLKAL